jgi:isochorismate synthase
MCSLTLHAKPSQGHDQAVPARFPFSRCTMDTVFPAIPTGYQSAGSWTIPADLDFFRSVLDHAIVRTEHIGHEVLASIVLPVNVHNPLSILRAFRQLQKGECVYWEQPARCKALVGVGIATTIEATGSERFATATTAWRTLQQDAVLTYAPGTTPDQSGGPILLGGFAFDPLAQRTSRWDGFPEGLLILPQMLFHVHNQQATLTLNRLVQADSDVEAAVQEWAIILTSLQTIVQDMSATPTHLPSSAETPSPGVDTSQFNSNGDSLTMQDLLPQIAWQEIVARAVTAIKHNAFTKIVLARNVQVNNDRGEFDVLATLERLRTNYPGTYVFAIQRGERYFVGATPEQLVYGQDGQIRTIALAGSIARGVTEEEDQRLGTELLHSQKNNWEHQIVVSTIREALTSLCSQVWVADTPRLLRLKNIQHLQTPIVGDLLPGRCVLEALAGLHPTPAVGGFPRQPALTYMRKHEQLDRGWYAGPIGWIDPAGNGEFAVALRSGLIDGNHATLFAGCGIVSDSQPESEYAESCLKLQVMLRGLAGNQ